MKNTKAARIHKYGGPDEVQLETASLPDPQAGEILIRVHAAGVNPIDWKIRAGYIQQVMPLPLPITLGGDFSGTVEVVGPGVANFKVGDAVFGQAPAWNGSGSYSQFLLAKSGTVALKPSGLSHIQAAALPLVGVSALQALTEHLRVTASQKVLIHGGAGGIGSLAIQLAKDFGAEVATTVATSDVPYAKSLGADTVIDYTHRNFEEAGRDIDATLDTVGGDTYRRSFTVIKKGGRIVSMLERPRQDLAGQYGVTASMLVTQITSERLVKLAELVTKGALKVKIDEIFTLDQAPKALLHLEKGLAKGKVVLAVAA